MPKTLSSLTGLRAFAALAVFASHAAVTSDTARLFTQGRVGVSFFFALSGFVLMWALDDRVGRLTFWGHRFARIYPAYIAAWVAGIALTAFEGGPGGALQALGGALLVQSWVPDHDTYFSFNAVAWSLSTEVFFYATFPFWARRLATATPAARRRILLICVGGVVAIGVAAQVVSPGGDFIDSDRSTAAWFVRTFPPVRVLEFVAGAILAIEMRRGVRAPLGLFSAAALTLVAYLVSGFYIAWWTQVAVPLVPLLLLIAAAAQRDIDREGSGSFLASPLFVWCGTISYCFYLVHQMAVRAIHDVAGDSSLVLRLPLALIVATVAAATLHYVVERPANRILRYRSRTVDDPAPVTVS